MIVGSRSMIDKSLQPSTNLRSMLRLTTRNFHLHSNPMKRSRLILDGGRPYQTQHAPLGQPHYYLTQQRPERRCMLSTSATSSGPSFLSSPLQWWRSRQETNELEKYKLRIVAMAEKESWLIGDAIREIDDSLNTWKAKVPGASSMNEIKVAKEMVKSLNGIAKVVGSEATEDVILKMSHKDKLLAAVNGETTIESINTLIEQFCAMSLMQRALRKRKLEKKTLPVTPEAVTSLLKVEAPKLMSKEQKARMGKEQAKRMMKRKR